MAQRHNTRTKIRNFPNVWSERCLQFWLISPTNCTENLSNTNTNMQQFQQQRPEYWFVFHASEKKDKNNMYMYIRGEMRWRSGIQATARPWLHIRLVSNNYHQTLVSPSHQPPPDEGAACQNIRSGWTSDFGTQTRSRSPRWGFVPAAALVILALFHNFIFIPVFDSASLAGGCFGE